MAWYIPGAGWGWPFTKSWMVPAVVSWTPTMWYQVPGDGARLAPETVVAALTESEASLVKAKVPVSARNCRKNPLILVPSMLTTVWKPLVALSFTHAETVKLCDVLTTGPATATLLVAVPLNATLCGPISPGRPAWRWHRAFRCGRCPTSPRRSSRCPHRTSSAPPGSSLPLPPRGPAATPLRW